jgi:hypothetical protein
MQLDYSMCRWGRNTYLEREAGTFLLRVDSIEIFHKVAAVINIYFTTFLRKSARIIPLVTKARRQSPYLMMAWSWILFGWGKCVSALHTEKIALMNAPVLPEFPKKKVVPFLLLQMIQNRWNLNPRRHLFLPQLFTLHLSSDYWISDYKQHSVMWDFKFSRRRVWCSELSSGLYCRVEWLSTFIIHGSTTQKTALNIVLTTPKMILRFETI